MLGSVMNEVHPQLLEHQVSCVKEGHSLNDADLVIIKMETPVKDPVQNRGNLESYRNRREVEHSMRSLRRCRREGVGVSEMQLEVIPDHSLSRECEVHMELLCGIQYVSVLPKCTQVII